MVSPPSRLALFMLIISYMYNIHIHDSLHTIAALYLHKYTSKEGLELFRLLTMELCFVKNVLQDLGVPCATCMIHYMRPCM